MFIEQTDTCVLCIWPCMWRKLLSPVKMSLISLNVLKVDVCSSVLHSAALGRAQTNGSVGSPEGNWHRGWSCIFISSAGSGRRHLPEMNCSIENMLLVLRVL